MGLGWEIIFKWPFKNNFSNLRSSSMLSANLKLKISDIFNVWLLLILKFSSTLKVIIIFRFSFISIWGLFYQYFWIPHSILNLMFFKFKNPFNHSKVTGIFVILLWRDPFLLAYLFIPFVGTAGVQNSTWLDSVVEQVLYEPSISPTCGLNPCAGAMFTMSLKTKNITGKIKPK